MKIALFGKALSEENRVFMNYLLDNLQLAGVGVSIYRPFLQQIASCMPPQCKYGTFENHEALIAQADLMFSIGGDGTMLDAVPMIRDSGMPILGINMGRLGFLSNIQKDEIDIAIRKVLQGAYHLEKRTLLELLSPCGVFDEVNFALNELSVIRYPENSLLSIKVFVDDIYLNTYWGDGILLATPTGSTAYSLSAGGPIVAPTSRNFLITPIAAHNLTVRPIVIPDDSVIRIQVEGRERRFVFSMDSRIRTLDTSVELTVRKAPFCINTMRMEGEDFFATIRNKLMWGKDNRN